MVIGKKAIESEGVRFNFKTVTMLIVFLCILAILLWWLVPKIGSGQFNRTIFNFATNIWDVRTGGAG